MISAAEARQNRLLAALPDAALPGWLEQLKPIQLPLGLVLYASGQKQTHAYFPATAIVSLLTTLQDGHASEVAVIGNEGIIGTALFMGDDRMAGEAVVRNAGLGYRVGSQFIKEAFGRDAAVTHLLLRHTQALITQMAQTAVCNRLHTVDARLCRWLLFSLDRLPGSELVVTQELIAQMLGVRREGVTEAASKLQAGGLIRYARGRISILDRAGLERCTCECYAVVKREYDRLLAGPGA